MLSRTTPPPAVRQTSADGRPKNRLLAMLPDDDFQHLLPHLKTVLLHANQILHRQGERLRHVYFLNGGVCSLTTLQSDGSTAEAVSTGDKGMVGIEAFLIDDAVSPGETIIQVPDTSAEMLTVQDFRGELAERPALRALMGRYLQFVIAEMVQLTTCNALHCVPERCSCRLLMRHDCMHEQDFKLSHELLATMLAVSRPTVSVVAETLQAAGFICYKNGRITVLDRKGLESVSCECYSVIRAHFDRFATLTTNRRLPTCHLAYNSPH